MVISYRCCGSSTKRAYISADKTSIALGFSVALLAGMAREMVEFNTKFVLLNMGTIDIRGSFFSNNTRVESRQVSSGLIKHSWYKSFDLRFHGFFCQHILQESAQRIIAHSLTIRGTTHKLMDWTSELSGSEVSTRSFEQLLPDECFTEQELDILFCPIMRW